jgi:hypothetical protein
MLFCGINLILLLDILRLHQLIENFFEISQKNQCDPTPNQGLNSVKPPKLTI